MFADTQIVLKAVAVCQTQEINVAVCQNFIKQQIDNTRLLALNMQPYKAGRVIGKSIERISVLQGNTCGGCGPFHSFLPYKRLRFVRKMLLQFLHPVAFELWPDIGIRAIPDWHCARNVKPHTPHPNHFLGRKPFKVRHLQFTHEIALIRLNCSFQAFCIHASQIKSTLFCSKPIRFSKGTLEAVALNTLNTLMQIKHSKGAIACGISYFVILNHLRSKKPRLIQRVIAVDVERYYLDHERIAF